MIVFNDIRTNLSVVMKISDCQVRYLFEEFLFVKLSQGNMKTSVRLNSLSGAETKLFIAAEKNCEHPS